jgi:hypothetical protein
MSVTRSPRLAEIRRREDDADMRRVRNIVGGIVAGAAIVFLFLITLKVF